MTAFSIVIPCYNEEEAIPALLSALIPRLEERVDGEWEIVFVDDGSRDRSLEAIAHANASDPRVKAVVLSRNFGHQAALACGLAFASGEIVGIMDCDLQDTPEVLLQLYSRVKHEGFDVCYGVRKRREASVVKNACYRIFYRFIRLLAEHPWPEGAGDFSVFNRRVHRTILSLPETVRVLRGLRSWVGFRQSEIAVDRPKRKHGATKYSLLRLCSLAVSSFTGFSYVPLRISSMIGIAMGFFSLLLGALFLLNRWVPKFTLFGYSVGANAGTTTIILFLAIISSMLFFCLGIMGEYLVVLLKEAKGRPTAIPDRVIGDVTMEACVALPRSWESGLAALTMRGAGSICINDTQRAAGILDAQLFHSKPARSVVERGALSPRAPNEEIVSRARLADASSAPVGGVYRGVESTTPAE